MYKLIILAVTVLFVNGLEEINRQLINKNVERTIDLTSQLVKITATITLDNTGKDTVRNYLLVLEPGTFDNVSYVAVKDSLKEDLKVIPTQVNGRKDDIFYNVYLKQHLTSGRTTNLYVELVLTDKLTPYPSRIGQKEKQLVRYFGNHYLYSPYNTVRQITTVTLGSKNLESYSRLKPVSQSEATITYGPYSDVVGFTLDKMMVHFENNAPFLTVTRLERLIEISHWGNIAVEENIEILHTGAKLKGPFSRYDYQRDTSQNAHHSIKAYRTILPSAAHSVYYRDSNGNISTSTVRPRKDWIELELRPRFPLFGGWRSSYTLGYSVPSYQYLYKAASGEYVLNMRLLDHVFDDMHVNELETSILLPVGVGNVRVKTPYDVEKLPESVAYKYLDNIGRRVIRLRKTNLVENHIQDIEIRYNWEPYLLLHEPLCITSALMIMFVVVIIYVRLDFSVHKQEHSKKD